jgi:hypothetical protein
MKCKSSLGLINNINNNNNSTLWNIMIRQSINLLAIEKMFICPSYKQIPSD